MIIFADPASVGGSDSSLPVGAIVGGVVGSVVVLAAIIVLAVVTGVVICVMKRKKKQKKQWYGHVALIASNVHNRYSMSGPFLHACSPCML